MRILDETSRSLGEFLLLPNLTTADCIPDNVDLSAPLVRHTIGEQSPIRIALNVARLCVREMDLVTRWHAEGLAFLLPGTSASETKTVARRFRAALAANAGGARPRLSISIGIAEGIEGNDVKRVLERAWLALEAARTAGSGNIYIHDGLKSVGLKLAAVAR